MPQPYRYDWDSISIDYIQGLLIEQEDKSFRHVFPSYRDLAEKYGANDQVIGKRAREENWITQRDLYRSKTKSKLEGQRFSQLISESTQFDARSLAQIKQVEKLVELWLSQYSGVLDPDTDELYFAEEIPRPSMKDLDTLMGLLTKKHNLTRSILGEPVNADTLYKELEEAKSSYIISDKARQRKIEKLARQREDHMKREKELEERKRELIARIADLREGGNSLGGE